MLSAATLTLRLPQRITFEGAEAARRALERECQPWLAALPNSPATGKPKQPSPALRVSGAALGRFDSSALAVMLALQRLAQAHGCRTEWVDLPEQLRNLMRVYAAQSLFLDTQATTSPPITEARA